MTDKSKSGTFSTTWTKKTHGRRWSSSKSDVPLVAIHTVPPKAVRNFDTPRNAQILVDQLTHYWHQRGYPLAYFWIENGHHVKSNLVCGVPPK